MFADDTNIIYSHKDFKTLISIVNFELYKVSEWFRANKLSLNVKKTNFILFGHKRVPIDYDNYALVIDNNKLEQVSHTKFLGIIIDDKLNWRQHISHICIKISKGLGILNCLKYLFPESVLLILYHSLIYPYMSYCCIIWGCAFISHLNKLLVLQKRAVRLITHSSYRATTGPLFQRLQLLRIMEIHKFQVLVFMYQIKCNLLPISCLHYCHVNSASVYSTRFTSYFKLLPYRTITRLHCLSVAGPRLWNSIPDSIKNSASLSLFKRELKLMFIGAYDCYL